MVKFGYIDFSIGKRENSDFSESIAACDQKDRTCRQRRYVSIEGQGHFLKDAMAIFYENKETLFDLLTEYLGSAGLSILIVLTTHV